MATGRGRDKENHQKDGGRCLAITHIKRKLYLKPSNVLGHGPDFFVRVVEMANRYIYIRYVGVKS